MKKNARLIPVEDVHPELIENGVPKNEQHMTREKVFWAFCTPNINLTSWLFGIIAAQGLGFWWAVLAIVLGNLAGSVVVAFCGVIGPQTRFSSLEGSRFSFGRRGVKLPAFLNWVNSFGWDAINNIPAAAALAAFAGLYGFTAPFWLALAALSAVQMIIAIYGHHMVQVINKYMGYLLCVIFVFLGIRACIAIGGIPVSEAGFSFNAFLLAFSVAAMGSGGYAPYAADYTRYLPPDTPKKSIFIRVFAGLFISYVVMEVFGIITASLIKEQTPDALMDALRSLSGGTFAPLVLLAAGLGTIPANAMNDNSAAYCLVSSGIRIPRPISAALAGLAGFCVAVYGAGHLSTIVEDTLLLLFYWIAPWTAIVLVHWFMSGMREKKYEKGWTAGATIFCIVTAVTIGLFSSNDLYTGPVAKSLDGADIGYYVGFFAAGILYWLALRRAKKN